MPVVVGGTQAVPGCQDFATLKDRVARYVRAPDDSEVRTTCGYEINDAIRELDIRNWMWALTSTTITLVAGTSSYAIPTDFRSAFLLERINSGGLRIGRISYQDPKTFHLENQNGSLTGSPKVFTVENFTNSQTLTLEVAPDSSFVANYPTLNLRYHRRLPVLTNDSDCLDCPAEVELFIIWAARYSVALQMDTAAVRVAPALRMRDSTWQALVESDQEVHYADWLET